MKDARSSLIPSYKTFSFFNLTLSERASKVLNVSNGLDINKITAKYYFYKLRSDKGVIGMEYFKKRNLSDEIITKFGLGVEWR